jgi:hypothetical protein
MTCRELAKNGKDTNKHRHTITTLALKLLKQHPDGIRYSDLVQRISDANKDLKINTIHGNVWNLDAKFPAEVSKPSRGLFRLAEFSDKETGELKEELIPKLDKKIKEEDFYGPFAEWLVNDLEDCTKAIGLGGNLFKDKWGTPDVIGKRESKLSDILKVPTEIVSAEIKLDVAQLVTAFGQACADGLYSHKSYLVIPQEAPQDEIARLDSLCQVFGIGLILFDASSPQEPRFDIRVRPVKREPDMFYANKYMRLIEDKLF